MTAAPAKSAALAVREVSYRTPDGTTLLAEVSVRVEPGRVLAVVGPNGAGKTTLLRLLASELLPTGGQILLEDRPLDRWPAPERARRVAILPQQSTFNAALTGLEVALLGRSPHPMCGGSPVDLAFAHEALVLMDAGHLAVRLFPSLSGGEKSRVQTARVLAQILGSGPAVSSARFLLLDEPTAALDCAHQHQLLGRIRQIARAQNIGVLAILHDLNLAAQYADELLALKDGRTAAFGPISSVFKADMLSAVFGFQMLVIPHPSHPWPLLVSIAGSVDEHGSPRFLGLVPDFRGIALRNIFTALAVPSRLRRTSAAKDPVTPVVKRRSKSTAPERSVHRR